MQISNNKPTKDDKSESVYIRIVAFVAGNCTVFSIHENSQSKYEHIQVFIFSYMGVAKEQRKGAAKRIQPKMTRALKWLKLLSLLR